MPTGVEVDAVVSDAEVAQLEAMGADVLPKGRGFEWSWARDGGFASPFGARSLVAPEQQDTVRIARADWFTTKGQGFLYVEAKTTDGAQSSPVVTMQLENDIKFFMSVHSNGGQLFWQPGAYIAQGRITTPRPPLRDEAYYWQSAERILSHVKAERETVVTPENVGGSSDVLYSSAGNVREDLYHNYGIYAFGWEVGGSVYNPATGDFQDGSFQPPWVGDPNLVSGHSETLEYTNGVMEMFRITAEWGDDRRRPAAELVPGGGTHTGPVDATFETSEPATVYYTTDGSKPTLSSTRYKEIAFREGGEKLPVTETTTFKWFSVDTAGNVEGNYDPAKNDNYRQATITIAG